MAEELIQVEVVHAGLDGVLRSRVSLPVGSTAIQAIDAAGWLPRLPPESTEPLQLGIFSRRVGADHVLRDGDRVEIYRPLRLDPMASRRRRASRG